jgi:molecular chaperone DnaK (HSP70)
MMTRRDAFKEIIVVDCGGGTSDWAYLRYQGEDFELVPACPPGGDRSVGRHDVDLELVTLLKEALDSEAEGEIDARQPQYLHRVRTLKERYCRGATA